VHLKGALHVHTTCSDGEMSIEECIGIYLRTGLIVFKGVELTVFEKGYCHVNRIEGDLETLHIFNHPGQLDLPLEKVVERLEAVATRIPLDAVEITSYGFKTPEYDSELIPYPKVATDDSHHSHMCGRAWIEMDGQRDKDAIIRAVKNGDFWNCYNNQKKGGRGNGKTSGDLCGGPNHL
jgi:hypothetical protein